MFRFWQLCPYKIVLLTVLPQCAFWVFVGGLVGCTFKWGVEGVFPVAENYRCQPSPQTESSIHPQAEQSQSTGRV